MRHIDLIVIHCSATHCNRRFPVTALIRCHADRFGFTGYHYYITRDGQTYQTRHEQLVGDYMGAEKIITFSDPMIIKQLSTVSANKKKKCLLESGIVNRTCSRYI